MPSGRFSSCGRQLSSQRMRRRSSCNAVQWARPSTRPLPLHCVVSAAALTHIEPNPEASPSTRWAVLFHAFVLTTSSLSPNPPFRPRSSCCCICRCDNGWPAVSVPTPGLENGAADAVANKPVCATFEPFRRWQEAHFLHVDQISVAAAKVLDQVGAFLECCAAPHANEAAVCHVYHGRRLFLPRYKVDITVWSF